jgi:hypothetical protein
MRLLLIQVQFFICTINPSLLHLSKARQFLKVIIDPYNILNEKENFVNNYTFPYFQLLVLAAAAHLQP